MEPIIKKSADSQQAFDIAKALPDFFDENALKKISSDTKQDILFGAYLDDKMVGFVTYKEINKKAIELTWLGVLPDKQSAGIGSALVNESLKMLGGYSICEVKTLSESDPYEPYKKTRKFYESVGFVPIETIQPYPGWREDNPCQIFVRCLRH